MFNIVLYTPQIPQNTGNIIRLCANTGCNLHLIQPLGFRFDDAKMRRSGLDYHEFANVKIHNNWQHFTQNCYDDLQENNLYALTTHGHNQISTTKFNANDYFLFGSETSGLPIEIKQNLAPASLIRLPMRPQNRSLNLANSVAIIIYHAWAQHDFIGGI